MAYAYSGASSLTSSEAFVDSVNNPNGTVPSTGSTNVGSLGATRQGGGNGINATAAWYSELDVSSITLEYWARTGENTATIISRSFANDGIAIENPSSLDITYWVDVGGVPTSYQLQNVYDMDTVWRHYAFSYDDATGLASFYVDDVVVASFDGPDNAALHWGTDVDLQVGDLMDFAGAFNGTLDELRIHDRVMLPAQFLTSPEPGTAILVLTGLVGLAANRRRCASPRPSDRRGQIR
jgi:hypothetical protein